MENPVRPKPIYATNGDCRAMLIAPNIFNLSGEWIGWVTPEKEVFDVDGLYVGWLSADMRILRKRSFTQINKRNTPQPPNRIRAAATMPLAPLMAELPYSYVDVLEEEPNRLHTLDSGELKEDMN